MKKLLLAISLLFCLLSVLPAQSRISLTGGYEMGFMNMGRLGVGYEQNMKSTRYVTDLAWRYNGANHLVFEGGYRYDSCAFINTAEYLALKPGKYGNIEGVTPSDAEGFVRYNTNSMLKMKSAMLGLAYRLAFDSKNFGVMFQTGAAGQYMYQASRFKLPDEHFEYRLYDEINPYNVLWRTKLGLRLSVVNVMVGYEMPFLNTINHDEILKTLPGDPSNRSADLRGLRLDADALFVSFAIKITFGEAYQIFNKLASGQRIEEFKN